MRDLPLAEGDARRSGRPGGWAKGGAASPFASRESPWEGCRREILEELGLHIDPQELLAYEHRRNAAGIESNRWLFAGPVLTREQIDAITLPPDELSELRFVSLEEAVAMLEPAQSRRVHVAMQHRGEGRALYLENGELRP